MKYGLKQENLQAIIKVLSSFDEVEEAILYGSRAKETSDPASDIDLTLKGEKLNIRLLNKISWALDELLLPYIFDLSLYNQINNPDLLEHIHRIGKLFYSKNNQTKKTIFINKLTGINLFRKIILFCKINSITTWKTTN
ncbi:MAG: nucleotidyltransferase domain-containing protein [Bacteroidales bacterium]|nr:nucleotidyltransferase domain-containing protein [Bacteroidales bacterium]